MYRKKQCIGKNKLYIGFGTSCGFRVRKLGALEHNPLWIRGPIVHISQITK